MVYSLREKEQKRRCLREGVSERLLKNRQQDQDHASCDCDGDGATAPHRAGLRGPDFQVGSLDSGVESGHPTLHCTRQTAQYLCTGQVYIATSSPWLPCCKCLSVLPHRPQGYLMHAWHSPGYSQSLAGQPRQQQSCNFCFTLAHIPETICETVIMAVRTRRERGREYSGILLGKTKPRLQCKGEEGGCERRWEEKALRKLPSDWSR